MTNQIPLGLSDYQSYRNLPALAGLGTMTDAMGIGLSVEECVRRLKRHHWTWRRLHQIFIARLTAEPIYELKMGFSLHPCCSCRARGGRRKSTARAKRRGASRLLPSLCPGNERATGFGGSQ
jgi:hypothetical protein